MARDSRRNYDEPKFRYYFLIADEPGTERVSGLGFAKPGRKSQQNDVTADRPDRGFDCQRTHIFASKTAGFRSQFLLRGTSRDGRI